MDLRSGEGFPEGLIDGLFWTLLGIEDGFEVGCIVRPLPTDFGGNLCDDEEERCCMYGEFLLGSRRPSNFAPACRLRAVALVRPKKK